MRMIAAIIATPLALVSASNWTISKAELAVESVPYLPEQLKQLRSGGLRQSPPCVCHHTTVHGGAHGANGIDKQERAKPTKRTRKGRQPEATKACTLRALFISGNSGTMQRSLNRTTDHHKLHFNDQLRIERESVIPSAMRPIMLRMSCLCCKLKFAEIDHVAAGDNSRY